MNEILDRYLELNEHAASYTWKRLGRPLDMDQTMEENDIPDESKDFIDLNLDEDSYIPCVHLYYNDDLTVAWVYLTKKVEISYRKIKTLL